MTTAILAVLALILGLVNLVVLGVVLAAEVDAVRRLRAEFTKARQDLSARDGVVDSQLAEFAETRADINAVHWQVDEVRQTLYDYERREARLVAKLGAAVGVSIDLEEEPR